MLRHKLFPLLVLITEKQFDWFSCQSVPFLDAFKYLDYEFLSNISGHLACFFDINFKLLKIDQLLVSTFIEFFFKLTTFFLLFFNLFYCHISLFTFFCSLNPIFFLFFDFCFRFFFRSRSGGRSIGFICGSGCSGRRFIRSECLFWFFRWGDIFFTNSLKVGVSPTQLQRGARSRLCTSSWWNRILILLLVLYLHFTFFAFRWVLLLLWSGLLHTHRLRKWKLSCWSCSSLRWKLSLVQIREHIYLRRCKEWLFRTRVLQIRQEGLKLDFGAAELFLLLAYAALDYHILGVLKLCLQPCHSACWH